MKRWRSLLVFLLILTLVFSLAAALSGCTKSDVSDGSGNLGTSEGSGNSDGLGRSFFSPAPPAFRFRRFRFC